MIENYAQDISALLKRLEDHKQVIHTDELEQRVVALEKQMLEPGFWDDAQAAGKVASDLAAAKNSLKQIADAQEKLEDLEVANELALEADDETLAAEVIEGLKQARELIDELEISSWFTGEFDAGDAIVTVNPGQGGLEAQDWTEMLFKMYLRYCDKKGWKVKIIDATPGEAIGLDRACFSVSGPNAYGMLRSEIGVHRLVRISPTDVKERRQTTFAGVEVLPVLPDTVEVEIGPNDIKWDVFHSSGAGGQSVNTTDSAVRLTHFPTGTVITCQNERSQLQNKEVAMRILRSKLYELELRKREEHLEELRGPKSDISWGNQIRNYVLYPYQMVKDLRTSVETGNVDAVLGGDLDQFIIPYHKWHAAQ